MAHEFVDPTSTLRAGYVAPIVAELSNPTVAGIGGGIATGVDLLGTGAKAVLVGGAELAGQGVRLVAAGAGALLRLGAGPPVRISPATQARLEAARGLTRTVVVVTGGVVQGAVAMATSLGANAAAAIGGTAVGKSLAAGSSSAAGQAVCRVAYSTVGAVGAVWEGLELAAASLAGHVGGAATDLVGARWGAEAAAASATGLGAVGDLGKASLLTSMHLTPVTLLAQGAGAATVAATEEVVHPAPAVVVAQLPPAAEEGQAASAAAAAAAATAASAGEAKVI